MSHSGVQGSISHANDPPQDSFQNCLCLICRQVGHVVESCPRLNSASPDITTPGPTPPFEPASTKHSGTVLCDRCKQMNALGKIQSHHPFVLEDRDLGRQKRANKKTSQIPSLGPINSLRLLSSCPLCRLLFDITYLTEPDLGAIRGDLLVVTGWTIHRFERDLHWSGCDRGKGPYAKCAYTSVPSWSDEAIEPNALVEEAMDAIGVLDSSSRGAKEVPALGVRKVDPQTCEYSQIRGWLRRCDDQHPITCRPFVSEGLKQIKLIDVETRQIVAYPPDGCDYIALSYVWGGVQQPSFRLGDILPTVPETLEDAMAVTRHLGKRYFWADSLCIEQGNNEEKVVQIALMSTIYSGAWATIISLSARSARSGLPRVGTLQGVIPQLSCEIWGKHLLSVMPTLAQQISWSPWATRAWTFQEGLLSPRRIFFTNHQVYFECNAVQCCESLDDTHSPFHLPTDAQRQVALDKVIEDPDALTDAGAEGVLGRGVFRDPFRPLSTKEDAQTDAESLETYFRLAHTYTTKKMSYDADSLNAFSAVLTRLTETHYQKGFIQGLPLEDLPRALLWVHVAQPRRRDVFAGWSWVGWEGPVMEDLVGLSGSTTNFLEADSPPLRMWKAGNEDRPELIYDFNPTSWIVEEMEALGADGGSDTESNTPGSPKDEEDDADTESNTPGSPKDEGDDADSWEDIYESSEYDSEDGDSDNNEPIDRQNDPVTQLAKEMLSEATNVKVPEGIGSNELLVEGIVIRLTFVNVTEYYSDTDEEEDLEQRCLVHVEGQHKPLRLKFFGYNAAELVRKRSRKEQEFLLLSRMQHFTTPKMYNSLLLIDREGDVATRVGVANLRLDDVKLLEGVKPERRLVRLK